MPGECGLLGSEGFAERTRATSPCYGVGMTELIWDGKYKDGKKQGPVRIELPFQTIETVNESVQERQRTLELYSSGRETEWRNRLIWGDKKYVLPSLLPEFAGKVNLIYIDPPFDTGQDFSFTANIPREQATKAEPAAEFLKQPSLIEQKAYRDTWGVTEDEKARGIRSSDKYLRWFYDTAVLLRDLLADSGTIFVHLDVHMGPYVKAVMDEVFGSDNFLNEIVWYYYNKLHDSRKKLLPKAFDQILYYCKNRSSDYVYNALKEPRDTPVKKLKYKKVDGKIQNVIGEDGKAVTYESTERTVDNVWRIRCLQPANLEEWVGFETQKPVDLIERIISIGSRPDDLFLDCFVGSGASGIAAERLGRRWIACDLGRFAIHTARKRLLAIPNVRPFVVQNLGKYERQAWQVAEFPPDGSAPDGALTTGGVNRLEEQRQREAAYRQFILELYRAKAVSGHTWLHGVKGGRMVHVGAVDAPVTLEDVKAIAREVWRAVGGKANAKENADSSSRQEASGLGMTMHKANADSSLALGMTKANADPSSGSAGLGMTGMKLAADILGWDFAFEVNERARQIAAESRVDVAFKKIPREVLDKKAVEQGDVRFFELGALGVKTKVKGRELSLALDDFVIPMDDIPEEARRAIKHWSQLIDYWAVDWDYKGDTFHNQWQAYRTRKNPKIELETTHRYAEAGTYAVVVKVIDILGNDTTKTVEVRVK